MTEGESHDRPARPNDELEEAAGKAYWLRSKTEYAIAAVALVAILALAYVFFWQQGERTLTLKEFREMLNVTQKVAVIQDLRAVPEGDYASRKAIQDCGIELSFSLSYTGKNTTNYAYEGESCFDGFSSMTRTVAECEREMKEENRLPFTVGYNATQNRTLLYVDRVVYSGSRAFLTDCAIARIVR